MMPNTHGAAHTRLQILIYTAILAPLPLLPVWLGFAGPVMFAAAVIGGVMMLNWAVAIYRIGDRRARPRRAGSFSAAPFFISTGSSQR